MRKMPKKRDDYEFNMLLAFSMGMNIGYGIDHENLSEEEINAVKEFAESNGFKRKSLKI